MAQSINLFPKPVPWGIVPGPKHLNSIGEAIAATEMWLAVTPERAEYREERHRMRALRELLGRAQQQPAGADLQSARLAIRSMVRFALVKEQRRHLSDDVTRFRGPIAITH